MKMSVYFFAQLAIQVILLSGLACQATAQVDDHQITITSASDVTAKRQALIQYIWGTPGFPANKLPTSVDKNVPTPVGGLTNLQRVDTLHISMDAGQSSLAHHFIE